MSFILDAIKKSERERKKHRQPDLHSLQDSSQGRSSTTSRGGRWLMLLAAFVILAGAAVWLWPRLSSEFALVPRAELEQVQGKQPPVTQQSQEPTQVMEPERELQAAYAPDDELPPRHLIKELWEMPADFQDSLPDLEYSFHVYSKDPAKRTIFINGRSVKEGQMVARGLRLRMITSTGVIFHYRDRFFHVDVVENW